MTEELENLEAPEIEEAPAQTEEMVEIDIPVNYDEEIEETDLEGEPEAEPEPEAPAEPVKSEIDILREALAAQNEQHTKDMAALIEAVKPKVDIAPTLTEEQHYAQYFHDTEAKAFADAGLVRQPELADLKAEIAALRQQNQVTEGQRKVIEIERPHIDALRGSHTPEEVIEILAEKDELLKVMQVDPNHAGNVFTLAVALWSKKRAQKTATATSTARADKTQLQQEAGLPSSNGGIGRMSIPESELIKLGKMMENGQEDEAVRRLAFLRQNP